MDFFLALVILINASVMIAAGYLLWNLGDIFDVKLTEAIRKQDDRNRKYRTSGNGVEKTAETETRAEAPEPIQHPQSSPNRAGRPYRPRS